MQNENLHKLLEQVHNEIEQIGTLDENGREMLTHLAADIQLLLEHSEPSDESSMAVLKRLTQAIDHFEVSHPMLTSTLSQLSAVLSHAGI
jgi:hypothetical protein